MNNHWNVVSRIISRTEEYGDLSEEQKLALAGSICGFLSLCEVFGFEEAIRMQGNKDE